MDHSTQTRRTGARPRDRVMRAAFICLAWTAAAGHGHAQALFEEPVDFKVTKSCRASQSIHARQGGLRVRAGETYQAFGENKPAGGTHAYIGTSGSRRWLALSCGEYVAERPPFEGQAGQGSSGSASGHQACLPFFDEQENPVRVRNHPSADITPSPPGIDLFGQAVNQVCGPSGKVTGRTEFVMLMKNHPDVLADLMRFTGGKVFGDKAATSDEDAYLQDLVKAWYDVHAFDHIFCGETEAGNQIGGLHYQGRYQQLQASGEACRQPNYSKNEVVEGSIYSMGVKMKRPNGRWVSHDIKGYGLTLSAADILKVATRAFAENPTSSSASVACLQHVGDGSVNYTTVFVRRQQGIRTFYPDATPDTGGTRACKAEWLLD